MSSEIIEGQTRVEVIEGPLNGRTGVVVRANEKTPEAVVVGLDAIPNEAGDMVGGYADLFATADLKVIEA